MRKASKILFLVAAILSIVVALNFLVFGIVCLVVPNNGEFMAAFLEEYGKEIHPDLPPAEALEAVQAVLIGVGVMMIVFAVFGAVNSVLGFKAFADSKNGKPSKALNVLNIVFGVLSCVEVNIVGAIFALVADGQEERRAAVEKK